MRHVSLLRRDHIIDDVLDFKGIKDP